jgi:hypothetical protein
MAAVDFRFPDPWDIDDFQHMLDHLKADGYYLFEGEMLEPLRTLKRRHSSPECISSKDEPWPKSVQCPRPALRNWSGLKCAGESGFDAFLLVRRRFAMERGVAPITPGRA